VLIFKSLGELRRAVPLALFTWRSQRACLRSPGVVLRLAPAWRSSTVRNGRPPPHGRAAGSRGCSSGEGLQHYGDIIEGKPGPAGERLAFVSISDVDQPVRDQPSTNEKFFVDLGLVEAGH
jgi:hypothetical protein